MIQKKRAGVCAAAALVVLGCAPPAGDGRNEAGSTPCDPALAAQFTPRRPSLSRYELCTDPRPLDAAAPAEWALLALDPVDAFGAAGSYDRTALARLYGSARARRPRLDCIGGSI